MIAHVFATEKDTLSISMAEHGVEGLGEIDTYDVHVTNLPSGDYLNVVTTGSEAGYLIGKYQFDGTDAVSVWFPENEALEQAVKSGKLPGTTKVEGGMTRRADHRNVRAVAGVPCQAAGGLLRRADQTSSASARPMWNNSDE